MQHALSFDVEESFQAQAAADGGVGAGDWPNYERRLPSQVNRILDLLAEHNVTATFFVLGWVAQHQPDVVRRIAAAGHEIASHGMGHTMLSELTAETFREELRQSRKLLEDLAGSPVVGFRAATFSIMSHTLWALDVLAEEGFTYDSSIYAIRHDRYGIPGAPVRLHRAVGPAGGKIVEIPPLSMRMCGLRLAVGGGGYLRLFPSWMVRRGLKLAERAGQPGMIYLHPWELDPSHPELPMSRLARLRHRVGSAGAERKLAGLVKRFHFTSTANVLAAVDADSLPVCTYPLD